MLIFTQTEIKTAIESTKRMVESYRKDALMSPNAHSRSDAEKHALAFARRLTELEAMLKDATTVAA